MRYKFLFFLLLLNLSACTFQVDVLTPEPSADSELLTATPPPFPTFTFTPTLTPSPLPRNLGIYPIQFAPNGTYADVVDTILAGTSKTYSINALRGQVMSISVHQSAIGDWTIVPIKIVGADGIVLCPPQENRDCNFWRGVLPSSQDYFVTLTPVIEISDFIMRVAVNPPRKLTQSFRYLSNDKKLSFLYPDDFAPVRFPEMYLYKLEPELALQFIDTKFLANTNLVEAYFLFGTSSEAEVVESCLQPPAWVENEQITGEVDINGAKFTRSERGGAATGNLYEQINYRTAQKGACYDFQFMIHSFSPEVLAPQITVTEFDHAALLAKFESILSTLVIN